MNAETVSNRRRRIQEAYVWDREEVLKRLKSMSNPGRVAGMARFGINTRNKYGVSIPTIRKIAMEIGRNHRLAEELWLSRIHDARILAGMIDDPIMVTEKQMENWARGFDSWDICDQTCSNLFAKTKLAYRKAVEWSRRQDEFVKRAGFVMMATLAARDKQSDNAKFLRFLFLVKEEASDERNFVKKAVNWTLRQIGKRNRELNIAAIRTAKSIRRMDSKAAGWIARDALRELSNSSMQRKLRSTDK